MNLQRRSILTFAGAALAGSPFILRAQNIMIDDVREYQRGDPSGPREYVSFNSSKVASNIKDTKADYLPKLKDFGELLLEEASRYIGFNRQKNRDGIADMLEVFGLGFADSKGHPYAFCAAGIGYVAARVYAKTRVKDATYADVIQCLGDIDHHHFYPCPGVANMVTVASVHGRWVPVTNVVSGKANPMPGWLVVFKWNKSDHHIGILKSISGEKLKTVEFNTSPEGAKGSDANGGAVAERERRLNSNVLGFINPGISVRT
ncbi:hypothetical protein GJ700_30655 [Duganella sp. FT92W]|uniref:CHAP domain-containing protein n=1 Tax=Pseudoduganella rivuli TaxID=2666085 RepID=A0A7X2LWK2_9BURK|nr:hypothetical protein [Pseudoduganella rivuli]MRV76083.1 hypothetical protein [Pseudoduganella rivuli]